MSEPGPWHDVSNWTELVRDLRDDQALEFENDAVPPYRFQQGFHKKTANQFGVVDPTEHPSMPTKVRIVDLPPPVPSICVEHI
jgi:hypothetical protein